MDYAGQRWRGFIVTVILGIIGAVVGGWISTLFGFGKVDGFNFGSFAVAVIGALVVLFIYRKIKKLSLINVEKGCHMAAFLRGGFTTSLAASLQQPRLPRSA